MIIGIDASRANKPRKTGVQWYSHHLIQALKRLDTTNRYFLYTNSVLTGDLARMPQKFQQALLKWPLFKMWTLLRLSFEIRFGKYRPDVLFVPAHTIPLLTPERTVVTVHDIGFERFPELYKWTDKLYHKWTIKFIKKHADQIITISEFSKRELMDVYSIPEKQISVVYNGYDSEAYRRIEGRDVAAEVAQKLNVTDPYVMFIGRLEAKKNIAGLVQAFVNYKKKYPDSPLKLVLVGQQKYHYEEAGMILDNENMNDQVIQFEYLSSDDVALLYNSAQLFIFPSLYEGFGIPVLEAMACGAPVICSNTTSLPEVAGEAAIKFNPENIDAIVKAMETVLHNPQIREAMVEAGYEQVKKFSWEKCAEGTLKILTSFDD